MSLNYSNTIKNSRLQVVADAMNEGKINIYSLNYETLLVSLSLSNPSASILNGSLTIMDVPLEKIAVGTGIAAIAKIVNSLDELIAEGLIVGTSSANIIIDNTNIAMGQKVSLTSGIIIHG